MMIRDAVPEDASALLEIYSYYVLETAITFEYEVPSVQEFAERISHIRERYPYLVMVEDGRIIGYAYAGTFKDRAAYDWACEMTIYMARDLCHAGYGRQLYEALEKELADMGIRNLYACIGYPEIEDEYLTGNSAEFHAHLGYQQVGLFRNCGYKFDRWYHMIWMEKIVGEHAVPAEEPRWRS